MMSKQHGKKSKPVISVDEIITDTVNSVSELTSHQVDDIEVVVLTDRPTAESVMKNLEEVEVQNEPIAEENVVDKPHFIENIDMSEMRTEVSKVVAAVTTEKYSHQEKEMVEGLDLSRWPIAALTYLLDVGTDVLVAKNEAIVRQMKEISETLNRVRVGTSSPAFDIPRASARSAGITRSGKERKKPVPKFIYEHPTRQFDHLRRQCRWSGIGLQPVWVREALSKEGLQIDQIRKINPEWLAQEEEKNSNNSTPAV